MTVFDSVQRNYFGRSLHQENQYDYLNRSARPSSTNVRAIIEQWFSHYPATAQPELAQRFRTNFLSAFFELALHELMILHGFQPVPHPTISGTKRQPDFLVTGPNLRFYLEATLATDLSAKQRAEESIKAGIYDQINKIDSPNFFLYITALNLPHGVQPATKKVTAFLDKQLKTVDADTLTSQFRTGGFDSLPIWIYKDAGIRIEFRPIPKSPVMRGKKEVRPIGFYPIESQISTTAKAIKDAVCDKATRYGKLGAPYLVAINSLSSWGTDTTDIEEALFGSEQVHLDRRTGQIVGYSRKQNGAFYGPKGPQNTRVSGAIIGTILPYSIAKTSLTLYHHPHAEYPFDIQRLQIDQAFVQNMRVVLQRKPPLREHYKLDEHWPQTELKNGA